MTRGHEMTYSRVTNRAVRLGLGLITILFAAEMARPALGQCEVVKLLASDGAVEDFFGGSVSVNGDLAIVGAEFDDDQGVSSGSAYVYRFDPDTSEWVEEAKLIASDGMANDRFGGSVSVCGDLAVVGAQDDRELGIQSGSAYIFRYDGTTWIEEAKLLSPDGAAMDLFGISVSVNGNIVVVGTKIGVGRHRHTGSAYVFRYDGMNWNQEARLFASDGSVSGFFGTSVSVNDNVIVVGAYGQRPGGAAYIYRYDGTTWNEEAKLVASDGEFRDIFGLSVSLHEDVVMVGAWLDDDNGEDSGSSYIFRYDGQAWHEEAKLLASDGQANDAFGFCVSVWGDVAVASVNRNDDGTSNPSGLAYIFRYNGTTWIETTKLLTSDRELHHLFGRSVSVWRDLVFVGRARSLVGTARVGSVYIFGLKNQTLSCPPEVMLSFWPPNHQYVTIDVAAQAGAVDEDGNPLSITITGITQDESINGTGDGNTSCDALIVADDIAMVRRERVGNGDGRVYRINYIAQGPCGSTCFGRLRVEIPQDEFTPAVDNGQFIDATTCLSVADLNGDKAVNVSDLLLLLHTFGQFGPDENRNMPDGDVDQDGDVDVSDLLMLLGEWG